jgi:hypothetical protein
MYIIIFLIIIVVLMYVYSPYLDIFKDYRGELHIILWYDDSKGERKFINILGSQ